MQEVGYTSKFNEVSGLESIDLADWRLSFKDSFNKASSPLQQPAEQPQIQVSADNGSLLNKLTGSDAAQAKGMELPGGQTHTLNTNKYTNAGHAAQTQEKNIGLKAEAQDARANAQAALQDARRSVTAVMEYVADDMGLDRGRVLATFAPMSPDGLLAATVNLHSGGLASAYDVIGGLQGYPDSVKNKILDRVAAEIRVAQSPEAVSRTTQESTMTTQAPPSVPLENPYLVNLTPEDIKELFTQTDEELLAEYDAYIEERDVDTASNALAIEYDEQELNNTEELSPHDALAVQLTGEFVRDVHFAALKPPGPSFDPEAFLSIKDTMPDFAPAPVVPEHLRRPGTDFPFGTAA